jgi:DnaK suppressor protein
MDLDTARSALTAERDQLLGLLGTEDTDRTEDHEAESETGDAVDPAAPLEAQGVDDAVAAGLRDRLAAVERALARVADGSYGTSVRSGDVIPDARLVADPAAELTVEEAAADEQR